MHQQQEERTYFLEQEKEVIAELMEQPLLFQQYQCLDEEWRQRFLDFCTGRKTLPLTYDPFFKKVFHPDVHPKRLSHFISSLLDREVKVLKTLPSEENLLSRDALLIMDILVEMEDGSLANVEVQKIPYFFPAERMSCYSADLLMRQYCRVKGDKGKSFKYNDVKRVYTIIIFEKSSGVFHEKEETYIHMGRTTFDSGLKLELLQEYCLVALDVFKKIPYSKDRSERTAWLAFLATESVEDALKLAKQYPWLIEIYKELAEYMSRPEEVLDMFSEALSILDRNTVNYMIEEQQEEIEAKRREIEENRAEIEAKRREIEENHAELEAKRREIEENHAEIEAKGREIEENHAEIEAKRREIEENHAELEAKRREIKENRAELEAKGREIEENHAELEAKRREIEENRAELEAKRREIVAKDKKLEEKQKELEAVNKELKELRKQLKK